MARRVLSLAAMLYPLEQSSRQDRAVTDLIFVGTGLGLFAYSLTRRSPGSLVALGTLPLLYRAANGRWPLPRPPQDTRQALGGARGTNVRESVRLTTPINQAYAFWRQLENLPRFMSHVESVRTEGTRSHWVARAPGGMALEWEAEIINDEPDALIAWRSLPGSDISSAGSVSFKPVRDGALTEVTVRLQYALPAGKAADTVAWLFRRSPSQTMREDLRRLKQLLEAGELATATPAQVEDAR
jgi:uncharacterized membrane protein